MDDFYAWKRHPITQVIMAEFIARNNQITDELVDQAGTDSRADAFRSGYIKACRDFVNIQLDDLGEETHGS